MNKVYFTSDAIAIPYGTNFTWNLFLWLYSYWQKCKIKICKLDENLLYITTTARTKLGFRKIKILSIFHTKQFRGKPQQFYYHKVFVPYNISIIKELLVLFYKRKLSSDSVITGNKD